MKQGYVSESLSGLDFLTKYNLQPYHDPNEHLFLFGMYRDEDYEILHNHQSTATIIWQGMDSRFVNKDWIPLIRQYQNIAISKYVYDSLKSFSIPCTLTPITATDKDYWKETPLGNSIYFYTSDMSETSLKYYGHYYLKHIAKQVNFPIIIGHQGKYSKQFLRDFIYPSCFVNLRLTRFDGCPTSNLELGLCGRQSIFNGDIPGSLSYRNISDICKQILEARKPSDIRQQTLNYLKDESLLFET